MPGFGTENGLKPEQVGQEGTDMFLQEERYFRTYAAYFGRFIDAYRQQGIEIGMVMPQNEFNSAQSFPSCTWTPEGLARFLRYLGPEMSRRRVEIFFGTLERGNIQLLDVVMHDSEVGKYIQGVGVQWAGKNAVATIHQRYPQLKLYQSEQECGDGKNDWNYCSYTWDLMRHYLKNGATGYMYWNIALEPGGLSHWGWPQNSLITVDPTTKSYKYNYEYYLLKHVSHFVRPGARRLETEGVYDDLLAFRNSDGSVVAVLHNESSREKTINLTMTGKKISFALEPDSFNTVVFNL
jgi:glucosylceramidase